AVPGVPFMATPGRGKTAHPRRRRRPPRRPPRARCASGPAAGVMDDPVVPAQRPLPPDTATALVGFLPLPPVARITPVTPASPPATWAAVRVSSRNSTDSAAVYTGSRLPKMEATPAPRARTPTYHHTNPSSDGKTTM